MVHMLQNVLDHPHDSKYRLVQLDNAAFQSKIGRLRGGIDACCAIGFALADRLLTLEAQQLGARRMRMNAKSV
jgi:hypothetical protein